MANINAKADELRKARRRTRGRSLMLPPDAEARLKAHLRCFTREAIMRERLSTCMAIGAMVEAAITTSALQFVFSLAEQRETTLGLNTCENSSQDP